MTNSVPADHIHIKPHDVGAPSGVHQMEWQEIMDILHNLDDSGMVDAANDFHHLAHSLRRIAYQIAQHGKELAKNWKGAAADTALTHFEDLYQYTSSLSRQAKQTGNALSWLGHDVLPHYKNLQSPKATASGFSPAGQTAANEAAREYLRSLSGHIQAANNAIPATITGIPAKKRVRKPPRKPIQPTPQPPPPRGGPVTPPPSPVQPPTASPTTPPDGTLQSAGPVGTAPSFPGGVANPGIAGGSGAGAGGSGMALPVGLVSAADPAAADGADSASRASRASAADGDGDDMGMMPMAPGGSGSKDAERWRRSETDEDDDLWGVPACGTEAVIE